MTGLQLPKELQHCRTWFEDNAAGYESWGRVEVLQVFMRDEGQSCWRMDITSADPRAERLSFGNAGMAGSIFQKRKNVRFILLTRQDNASQVKEEIPPILDDQAQLLGVSVRVAEGEKDVLKALNGRYAAVLKDGTSICLGATLEDAWVAAQLLEKTSKAFQQAKVLGGAKPINRIEAWLMQQFYQLKYSKEAKRNV